jgi:hypothetical protein
MQNIELELHEVRKALKSEINLTSSQKRQYEEKICILKKKIKTFREFEITLIATCDEIYYNFLNKYHKEETLVPQSIHLSGTFDPEIILNYFKSKRYINLVESYKKLDITLEYNLAKNKLKVRFNPAPVLYHLSADFF